MTSDPETGRQTAGVIAPPLLLLVLALAGGFALDAAFPLGLLERLPEALRLAAGAVLSAAALVILLLGVTRFGTERTPASPYRAPARLVTTGIYAVTHNPMYVGFDLLPVGLALIYAADWLIPAAAVLALVIHYGVVRREERLLDRQFGDEFRNYRKRVPRYLLF